MKRLAKIAPAAEYLDTSTKTVRRLIDSGEIVAFKVRHELRVDLDSVDRYLEGRRVGVKRGP